MPNITAQEFIEHLAQQGYKAALRNPVNGKLYENPGEFGTNLPIMMEIVILGRNWVRPEPRRPNDNQAGWVNARPNPNLPDQSLIGKRIGFDSTTPINRQFTISFKARNVNDQYRIEQEDYVKLCMSLGIVPPKYHRHL
ncbi:hypothetical protein [Catalinimonas niigatensis]|uniref:hypothetical protein n=1 Tax=Catalinimonas niigatensis TaxID=1397264 RepID=UPI0026652953|nr:hypothetical protein [Catalinimonas niigatensis]WPP49117.1 hypothetical protein PZB72_20840 [Catalinimonas niigatensis]